MTRNIHAEDYSPSAFMAEASRFLELIRPISDLNTARFRLYAKVTEQQYDLSEFSSDVPLDERVIVRDCARAFRSLVHESADTRAGFSVMKALWDLSRGVPRPDLEPGFYAEMLHLVLGLEGRAPYVTPGDLSITPGLEGRSAAIERSQALDAMWSRVESTMAHYPDGMSEEARMRRAGRQKRVQEMLGGTDEDWQNWRWHVRHIVKDAEQLERLVNLTAEERACVQKARQGRLPFGITPYYASLMDEDPEMGRDRAVRAQVIPPQDYLEAMAAHHGERDQAFDFMLEHSTSPIELVTRRYPAIAILKPFNTCPQICVYCQRNWEIGDAMAPHSLAPQEQIDAACAFLEAHPAIREVLVTGGDPLILSDGFLEKLLTRLSQIPSIDMIRLGSRIPVTLPMRITPELAELLGAFRRPGELEVCVVTHVEHPYEITPDLVRAVNRLRRQGIAVYNQLVYTFFVSRRFEAARLRMLLRRCGVDPYYTFVPKGKEETASYRVPLARLLQEQKEESRLLPGSRRTDEVVYNVPGLGKNHLRAIQHRDLISVLPDGTRVYEFHPWEKKIIRQDSYVGRDVSILSYLRRLADVGENPDDYSSIWYYF